MLDDLKRVTGKQNILFELVDASVSKPDGVVREGAGEAPLAGPVDRNLRALTSLIWEHVNPYGRFELDMTTRLPIG